MMTPSVSRLMTVAIQLLSYSTAQAWDNGLKQKIRYQILRWPLMDIDSEHLGIPRCRIIKLLLRLFQPKLQGFVKILLASLLSL
ncbi:hypothetical protein ES332_D05G099000v1 [Gossypium tomentosum]|uniref:Secreted protein n=1 Tax=Gossypium tomentosum TaxID=34277 RepID=A0A5D2KTT9_GOSTO|nr:hypothetical protein ES332_D05G099000v1 [Gossypium tomentosum]